MEKEFIKIFSQGLLQINFMANKTLSDEKYPMAEKVFYIDRKKTM